MLMGADVTTLDPQVPWDNVSSVVLNNIFESLVTFDRSFRLTGGLARRWINPDDRTWRFFLDAEARFHDGTPLRASDVRFSIERLRSLAGSEMTGFTRHIERVEVVDDQTVDLHTDTPVAILNSLAFIPIMSERQVGAAGDKVSEQPFGTGPYKLARWEKGKSIVLEANEHRRPLPQVRRIELTIREGPTLVDEVVATRPDLTLFMSNALIDGFKRRKPAELRIVSSGGLAVYYATLNQRPHLPGSSRPNPLRDPKLRRALAQGTDQSLLVREGLVGFGRPITQLIVPEVFGFDPTIETPAYDPAAASALLSSAGHSGAEVPILVRKGRSQRLDRLLMQMWTKIGLKPTAVELGADDLQKALAAGSFGAVIEGYSCTSADASEILSFCFHTPNPARGFGEGNHAAYSHPEVDRIAEENLRIFDPRVRLERMQKALRLVAVGGAYIPLFAAADVYIVGDGLRFLPRVDGDVRGSEISFEGESSGAAGSPERR